jgi:hypothetical protein
MAASSTVASTEHGKDKGTELDISVPQIVAAGPLRGPALRSLARRRRRSGREVDHQIDDVDTTSQTAV